MDPEIQEICELQKQKQMLQNRTDAICKNIKALVTHTHIPQEIRTRQLFTLSLEDRKAHQELIEIDALFRKKTTDYYEVHRSKDRMALIHSLFPRSTHEKSRFKQDLKSRRERVTRDIPSLPPLTIIRENERTEWEKAEIREIKKIQKVQKRASDRWVEICHETDKILCLLSKIPRFGPPNHLKSLSIQRGNAELELKFITLRFWRKVKGYWNDPATDPDRLLDALYLKNSQERTTFLEDLHLQLKSQECTKRNPRTPKTLKTYFSKSVAVNPIKSPAVQNPPSELDDLASTILLFLVNPANKKIRLT